ncbi:TasA family protein [Carnobacterium funditum]|uniref:TasA family protein n=1 Tax=Carnobacterium funditum TaxID=2752 RepID=UPI00054F409C|nr:TasA family protein [Carnobacterium funditum]
MKKKLSLLLGVILLMAGTAYGTWALFGDTKEANVGIDLKLGNLEITSIENEWVYSSSTAEGNKENSKQINLNNISPGDTFTKKYKVENTGSLPTTIKVSNNNEYSPEKSAYKIAIESISDNFDSNGTKLFKDATTEFKMVVKVPEDLGNEYNITGKEKENEDGAILKYMEKNIVVEATQVTE